MKKLLLLAALCATALFSNCKKEEEPPTTEELLLGKWKVTKFITMGTNAISETATNRISAQLEFKTGGVVIFQFTNTDLTANPPKDFVNSKTNSYTVSGANLSFSATSGTETVTVTGPATVTSSNLTFNATSGETDKFFESLEAEKL
jgi:hypothetical protein